EDWLLEPVPFRLPLIDGPLGNGITDTIGPDSVIGRWRAVFKEAFIKESWPARLILSRPEALPQRGLQRVFTGIVQGLAQIESIHSRPGLNSLNVRFPDETVTGVSIGASIALNGVCLTVTRQEGDVICFDVMMETLARTSLS